MSVCVPDEALSQNELEAARAYGVEATFFHAVVQGATEDLVDNPRFQAFQRTAAAHSAALASAISKCKLSKGVTVFSGHGRGGWSRGSLSGAAERFVGLEYCYPGFISTSLAEEVALRFLAKRQHAGSHPTLLEFRLPEGYRALDIGLAGHGGEFELVIGRHARFQVASASSLRVEDVEDPVLRLVLEPL